MSKNITSNQLGCSCQIWSNIIALYYCTIPYDHISTVPWSTAYQSPPGLLYLLVGDPYKIVHFPLFLGRGTTQCIPILLVKNNIHIFHAPSCSISLAPSLPPHPKRKRACWMRPPHTTLPDFSGSPLVSWTNSETNNSKIINYILQ